MYIIYSFLRAIAVTHLHHMTPLHIKVLQNIRQRKLLSKGSKILMAVSGGQDSLCLSKILLDLQKKWEWELAVAHCDHLWATDAGTANHVKFLTDQWNLPFYLSIAPSSLPHTEDAARKWRYEVLAHTAQTEGFTHVVTGHTLSDRAETILYNLIRGSGVRGLSTLVWQRTLIDTILLTRPLLNISRPETLEFCQDLQIPIWFDQANENPKYTRNRIRHRLLPLLKNEFNPAIEKSLAQSAEILRAEEDYLTEITRKLLPFALQDNQLNRVFLATLPLALQRRVIKDFLDKHINQTLGFEHIEEVVQLITAPNRSRTSSLPNGLYLQVQETYLILQARLM